MSWVQTVRSFGAIAFVDIRDVSEVAQVVFDEETPADSFEKSKNLHAEFVIAVQGVCATSRRYCLWPRPLDHGIHQNEQHS